MENREFRTREDYEAALLELCLPLCKYYSNGKALLHIGSTKAHYGDRIMGLEGFSRILWGIVPFWSQGGETPLDKTIHEGLINGTSPDGAEYWGKGYDNSQAFVEMAVIGLGLILCKDKFWDSLTKTEKKNLNDWLYQINEYSVCPNNWLFFRVLVNLGLMKAGGRYSLEKIEEALGWIEGYYLGEGWYRDGETLQRDYYISFAMHYYSLIYAEVMKEKDPERSLCYRERARLFAGDFIYWFSESGEAIPFGRSQTYRFAQCSFFCALAFAGEEVFSWGVIKGLVNRHFRYWFSQPILDCEDKLTIGYAYPNLNMAEGYNAPGSPYWAFKSFLVLALPKEHPFWNALEKPLPKLLPLKEMKHPMMLIQRLKGQVVSLTSGQYALWHPVHYAEKYEKFAYSSYFGFHVPRSYISVRQMAPDNMLAFLRDGYYHIRRNCMEVLIGEGKIYSTWSPMEGILVETTLIPDGNGHIRSHVIHAERECQAVEGGFGIPFLELNEWETECRDGFSMAKTSWGCSVIELLEGEGRGMAEPLEPNTNLIYPRTGLPYLAYQIPQGTTRIKVRVEGIPYHND